MLKKPEKKEKKQNLQKDMHFWEKENRWVPVIVSSEFKKSTFF
jgi:hypothetical protein